MFMKISGSRIAVVLLLSSAVGIRGARSFSQTCQRPSEYPTPGTGTANSHMHTCKQERIISQDSTPKFRMEYTPAPIGVEVRGIDLKDRSLPADVIEEIKRDVHKHRLLIFKNQGVVSGDRHVEISQWFGDLESTFYKHPRSPHPDVFRVSNNGEEGCTNVGRTGWHIDGSFMEKPFSFALYHMVAVPQIGNTGTHLSFLSVVISIQIILNAYAHDYSLHITHIPENDTTLQVDNL